MPERLAAGIGAALTYIGAGLWACGLWRRQPSRGDARAVMIVFPAPKAVIGLHVGLKVFVVLMKLGMVPDEICLECADISLRPCQRCLSARKLSPRRSVVRLSAAPDQYDGTIVAAAC